MSSAIPKAVLYYSPHSIWSSAALLALAEKGYGQDEVDLKVVDLAKGENFSPSFLRLNPKATVPTLVVPLEKTLSPETESRYKAITDTKAVVEFLDKSRSAISHTHTTSAAPAPSLAPATIAFAEASDKIIDDILHSEQGSPNALLYMNARDVESLRILAKDLTPFLKGRQEALASYLSQSEAKTIHVSEKVQSLWREKKAATEVLLDVLSDADKSDAELHANSEKKREDYFSTAKTAWEITLKDVLVTLTNEIVGPYCLGDQLSLADVHLSAWLARLVSLSGGNPTDDGSTAIGRLEAHIGSGFALPKESKAQEAQRQVDTPRPTRYQSKLAVFWDAVKERPSWQKVYGNGLR